MDCVALMLLFSYLEWTQLLHQNKHRALGITSDVITNASTISVMTQENSFFIFISIFMHNLFDSFPLQYNLSEYLISSCSHPWPHVPSSMRQNVHGQESSQHQLCRHKKFGNGAAGDGKIWISLMRQEKTINLLRIDRRWSWQFFVWNIRP